MVPSKKNSCAETNVVLGRCMINVRLKSTGYDLINDLIP